ncbi:unnamed protein product [Amoebophrya sp. A120]|nr:unnamed protein product [Amoebophrya sp. A120]|eukprot:GSA120T00013969001.1
MMFHSRKSPKCPRHPTLAAASKRSSSQHRMLTFRPVQLRLLSSTALLYSFFATSPVVQAIASTNTDYQLRNNFQTSEASFLRNSTLANFDGKNLLNSASPSSYQKIRVGPQQVVQEPAQTSFLGLPKRPDHLIPSSLKYPIITGFAASIYGLVNARREQMRRRENRLKRREQTRRNRYNFLTGAAGAPTAPAPPGAGDLTGMVFYPRGARGALWNPFFHENYNNLLARGSGHTHNAVHGVAEPRRINMRDFLTASNASSTTSASASNLVLSSSSPPSRSRTISGSSAGSAYSEDVGGLFSGGGGAAAGSSTSPAGAFDNTSLRLLLPGAVGSSVSSKTQKSAVQPFERNYHTAAGTASSLEQQQQQHPTYYNVHHHPGPTTFPGVEQHQKKHGCDFAAHRSTTTGGQQDGILDSRNDSSGAHSRSNSMEVDVNTTMLHPPPSSSAGASRSSCTFVSADGGGSSAATLPEQQMNFRAAAGAATSFATAQNEEDDGRTLQVEARTPATNSFHSVQEGGGGTPVVQQAGGAYAHAGRSSFEDFSESLAIAGLDVVVAPPPLPVLQDVFAGDVPGGGFYSERVDDDDDDDDDEGSHADFMDDEDHIEHSRGINRNREMFYGEDSVPWFHHLLRINDISVPTTGSRTTSAGASRGPTTTAGSSTTGTAAAAAAATPETSAAATMRSFTNAASYSYSCLPPC